MSTKHKPGTLTMKQAEQFIKLACNQSYLLSDVKIKRMYPWWQIPIRATIGWLAWRLKIYAKRWEYVDDEIPQHVGWVSVIAGKLSRLEDLLCGSIRK